MTAIIATPAALTTDLTEELAALIDAALEIRDLTAPLSFVDFFDGDEGDEENEGNEGDEDDEDNEVPWTQSLHRVPALLAVAKSVALTHGSYAQ